MKTLLLACILAVLTPAAQAVLPIKEVPTSKGMAACSADIQKLCKDVKRGDGRIGACLNANAQKLSAPCKAWASHGGTAHLSEALLNDLDGKAAPAVDAAPAAEKAADKPSKTEKVAAVAKGLKACAADIKKWCKDAKPGAIGACLKPHLKELSKSCTKWASHGGKGHADEALLNDLDRGAVAPPAAPKPKEEK